MTPESASNTAPCGRAGPARHHGLRRRWPPARRATGLRRFDASAMRSAANRFTARVRIRLRRRRQRRQPGARLLPFTPRRQEPRAGRRRSETRATIVRGLPPPSAARALVRRRHRHSAATSHGRLLPSSERRAVVRTDSSRMASIQSLRSADRTIASRPVIPPYRTSVILVKLGSSTIGSRRAVARSFPAAQRSRDRLEPLHGRTCVSMNSSRPRADACTAEAPGSSRTDRFWRRSASGPSAIFRKRSTDQRARAARWRPAAATATSCRRQSRGTAAPFVVAHRVEIRAAV
jgi:hypothetical protein